MFLIKFCLTLRKLFIEPHDDVTILYADVVNYTYLTTTLDVKTLVETLHDLFVKFDTASEVRNIIRFEKVLSLIRMCIYFPRNIMFCALSFWATVIIVLLESPFPMNIMPSVV